MEFTQKCEGAVDRGYEAGYALLCSKHAADGESLDKEFYEYVCDSILAEGVITDDGVREILMAFYPDYAIDAADVAAFRCAARSLEASRNAPTATEDRGDDIPPATELPTISDDPPPEKEVKEIWTEANVEDISYMCSIFPNVDISIVEHVYTSKCARNREPTVEYLLDNCSNEEGIERMASKLAEMQLKEARDKEEAANEAKKIQATVVQRYGDRAVVNRDGKGKKEEKVHLVLENPVQGAAQRKPKVCRGIASSKCLSSSSH